MRLLLLIFTLILTTAQATIAASKKESYYANRLSVGDGLPSNTIRAMVQDNDGYIWFGGTGGLARYDGYDAMSLGIRHTVILTVAASTWQTVYLCGIFSCPAPI